MNAIQESFTDKLFANYEANVKYQAIENAASLCFLVASFVKRVIIDCRIKGGIYERDSRIIY
ncbi:aminopeptidase [Streptococcus pneumoniae]|nr:aminopeptidase [Streptococcus pneumoniae]